MSDEPAAANRPHSARGLPNLRAGRIVEESLKNDKPTRRYAYGIEKALASFEPSQQEWADYIAFLGRLLRAIQAVKETEVIPHSALVSLRLAQCLNPSLPSGVHQKALEVYASVFELLGSSNIGRDLQVFLPGLLPLLSFASLTVRPLLYDLYDEHILKLSGIGLRPAVKSVILGLLPGIEDETSEDFERGVQILDRLKRLSGTEENQSGPTTGDGYFWQCFFLAVLTSENRRQGALAFLSRRLPSFGSKIPPSSLNGLADTNHSQDGLPEEAVGMVSPEPGLLIRCFAAGLNDANILVQRGFLDLLVTHIPLHSSLIQNMVSPTDVDLLVSAAVAVVLRRDMSLNRRLWSWFLGPEPSPDAEGLHKAPTTESTGDQPDQAAYFRNFGAASLQRCLLAMFARTASSPSDQAKPFRVSSALMDRWEIGGYLIPTILVPALSSAFRYQQATGKRGTDEVLRSASLFFDGIESGLIWANIINELPATVPETASARTAAVQKLCFLNFVVMRFNVREEDMLVHHMPRAVLVALRCLSTLVDSNQDLDELIAPLLNFVTALVNIIPQHALQAESIGEGPKTISPEQCQKAVDAIKAESSLLDQRAPTPSSPNLPPRTSALLLFMVSVTYIRCISGEHLYHFSSQVADVLVALLSKMEGAQGLDVRNLSLSMGTALDRITGGWGTGKQDFLLAASIIKVWASIVENRKSYGQPQSTTEAHIETSAARFLWLSLSSKAPKHHVEAVRLLWIIHRLSVDSSEAVDIQTFVTHQLLATDGLLHEFERFTVLWEHSVKHQPMRTERKASSLVRRPSSHANAAEISSLDAERLLSTPMMIVLDTLQTAGSDVTAFATAWLRNLPSMDRVLSGLLGQLEGQYTSFKGVAKVHNTASRQERARHEIVTAIQRVITRLANILQRGSESTWKALIDIRSQEDDSEKTTLSGVEFIGRFCANVLTDLECGAFEGLQRQLLGMLDLILASQSATSLQRLHLEDNLIIVLRNLIKHDKVTLQVAYLDTVAKALLVRETEIESPVLVVPVDNTSRPGKDGKSFSTGFTRTPPPGLFECIREAIVSSHSHQVLEHWMGFLTGVLPVYSQIMFSAMIPLVECFCGQINSVFGNLRTMATTSISPENQIPISSLPWLLHGLELVLASAHSGLDGADAELTGPRPSPSPQSLFGGSVSSPIGDPNRTAKSNSRLTVILCVHDAVEICFNMWAWASYRSEAEDADPTSAATTTFNALKLRNRTKKILEHLFAAEGLECTEKMATLYVRGRDGRKAEFEASNVFSLLNALGAARPSNTVPLVLNALYSRTNMDALDASRRSTLTCDLSAMDVVDFLLQYVGTIEDDALDEVWSDCITFLRDVLTNPLPHRQILPALLEFIALLAEKIDNTNFGELQQMHRALADLFSRLIAAMFTVRPSGGSYDSPARLGKSRVRSNDLITSLIEVAPKLQAILESPDRVLQAVNNITTYAIGPHFHAKAFPDNMSGEILQLVLLISTQAPEAKVWKKEVNDAYSDSRIFSLSSSDMSQQWFPVLRKWSLTEKNLVAEILARIVAPSTAVLMFGVGANSARLVADRTAQHNLRRTALLLLANDQDALIPSMPIIEAKVGELCTASASSSPSCATRAEVFMLWRALFLTTSEVQLAGLWPTINATLQAAILSALPDGPEQDTYSNLSLLQACKLLDLMATLQIDDFQLHEWVYITNTIDAVYTGTSTTSAIVDEVAEALSMTSSGDLDKSRTRTDSISAGPERAGYKRPMLALLKLDAADAKAMPRDEFMRQVLMPFLNGISMAAYEKTYGMGIVDMDVCRKDLIDDLMNEDTVV